MVFFRKKIGLIFIAILLFLGALFFFRAEAGPAHTIYSLPTYYCYALQELEGLHSTYLIREEKLQEWETRLSEYFQNEQIPYIQQLRFYTYLYLAQRDAAFLSYNSHQCFIGSLDPLMRAIVELFYPEFTNFPPIEKDAYSDKLAQLVFRQYQSRFKQEEMNPCSFHSDCWQKKVPEVIAGVWKWMPWVNSIPHIPAPISMGNQQAWNEQLAQLKQMRAHLTSQELDIAYRWANDDGLGHQWREIANTYMQQAPIPFAQKLFVRSVLMMGLFDGMYIGTQLKYTYCSPRPDMLDPSIEPLFSDPHTPAYPSGHATQGAVAATILTHFFPQCAHSWEELKQEEGTSRLWAGVHFPQDIEAGFLLGKLIAMQTLNTCSSRP